jgi:hypothetical protein
MVCASTLDGRGKSSGGGIVETFDKYEDAKDCQREILAVNPRYEPRILRSEK